MIQTHTYEVVNESIIKDIDSIVKTSGLAAEDKIKQIETILSKYIRDKAAVDNKCDTEIEYLAENKSIINIEDMKQDEKSYRDFYTLRFMNQQ